MAATISSIVLVDAHRGYVHTSEFFHLEILVAVVYVRSKMKAQNTCAWITIGSLEPCSKPCVFEHCKVHRARLRRGAVLPKPCRECGVGTQSEAQLCGGCGSERIKYRLVSTEKRVRQHLFPCVMVDLQWHAGRQVMLESRWEPGGWCSATKPKLPIFVGV